MRKTSWLIAIFLCGCGSDDGEPSGGSAGSAGVDAGSGGSAGSGGGAGASSSCVDATNPMFGSCAETFLDGCYEPDTSGVCTDDQGVVSWSDGSKFISSGTGAGMYGPGDAVPCIVVSADAGGLTATKGAETLSYVPDSATQTGTIHCPDGSSFTATFDQVTAFNRCIGINCPVE